MKEIKLRCVVEGDPTGEVLFSSKPIAFLQGVDPEKGCVSDEKHELYSVSFKDKILVYPNSVGSSVGAYVIYRLKKKGNSPRAIINEKSDIITASGCAIAGIPLFDILKGKFSDLGEAKSVNYQRSNSTLQLS
jgi:uncharacterized protein